MSLSVYEICHCLGYNEPNQAEQANLTPQEAATAWLELQVQNFRAVDYRTLFSMPIRGLLGLFFW